MGDIIHAKAGNDDFLELRLWTFYDFIIDDWLPEMLGDTLLSLQLSTDYLIIDSALLSRSNPVLPLVLPVGTRFYRHPLDLYSTVKPMYLHTWRYMGYELSRSVIPAIGRQALVAKWVYRSYPPVANPGFPYGDDPQEYPLDANGNVLLSASPGGDGFVQTLWRKFQWPPAPGREVGVITQWALQYHTMGGALDLSGWIPSYNEGSDRWSWIREDALPTGIAYKGTNLWYISPSFSANIEIDSGPIANGYYYYLSAGGGSSRSYDGNVKPPQKNTKTGTSTIASLVVLGFLHGNLPWNDRPDKE